MYKEDEPEIEAPVMPSEIPTPSSKYSAPVAPQPVPKTESEPIAAPYSPSESAAAYSEPVDLNDSSKLEAL